MNIFLGYIFPSIVSLGVMDRILGKIEKRRVIYEFINIIFFSNFFSILTVLEVYKYNVNIQEHMINSSSFTLKYMLLNLFFSVIVMLINSFISERIKIRVKVTKKHEKNK